jgi:hypothetical protein
MLLTFRPLLSHESPLKFRAKSGIPRFKKKKKEKEEEALAPLWKIL